MSYDAIVLRVLCDDLWPTIAKLAAKAERRRAAVAFVTSDAHVAFGEGDVLVTDASDEAISGGRTSARVLKAAHARGAQLFSLTNLHAKILCLGRFAVVGSANLSSLSAESLVEAAIVTDHPLILAEARFLVSQLQKAAIPVDEAFLERISAIPVAHRPPKSTRAPRVRERVPRTWLVGVHRLKDDQFPDEAEQAEEGQREAEQQLDRDDSDVSWIRFTGTSRFCREAQPDDLVIQIWRERSKSKSARVYFAAPIVYRQEEPTCTRFYVEEFSDEEERGISWKDFLELWDASTDAGRPPLACARLLTEKTAEKLIARWPS